MSHALKTPPRLNIKSAISKNLEGVNKYWQNSIIVPSKAGYKNAIIKR